MRTFLLLLLACSLYQCSVYDRVVRSDRPAADDPVNTTDTAALVIYQPAPTTNELPPSGGAVVLPRDQRSTNYPPTGAGSQVPGNGGKGNVGAPPAPVPYGQAEAPVGYGSAPVYADNTTAGTVEPHTTVVTTPATYAAVSTTLPGEIDADFANALTGLWRNAEDPDETVEFTTDHYSTFYEGQKLFEEPMVVHRRCPGPCGGDASTLKGCFTIAGPAGIDCFGIVRLSTTELELKLLGVSSETIVYRKL